MDRLKKIGNYFIKHKVISLILVIIVIFAGYKTYMYFTSTSGETRYIISKVQKGTILSTISGTGQVSALKQVSLTAKTSGEAVYVGARSGDYVSAGQLLAQVDSRDAKMALDSAKLSLAKAKELAQTESSASLSKNSSDSLTTINKYLIDFGDESISRFCQVGKVGVVFCLAVLIV